MSIEQLISVLSPLLSLGGAYLGSMIALARHDERLKVLESEFKTVRKRQHRHADIISVMAAKTGVRFVPHSEVEDEG